MADPILLILLILLLLFVVGALSPPRPAASRRASRRAQGRADRAARWSRPAEPRRDRAAPVAVRAMQRAGYTRGEGYVDVTDLGLLAYRSAGAPKLVRSGDLLTDTEHLRPFAELWLPYPARGPLRFELVDAAGRLRYADEARYDLEQGRNTLLPGTWLPLRGKTIEPGTWTLRLLAGETLLALHPFGWQDLGGSELQPLIEADGEISPELIEAMRAEARDSVSLDELLAGQEE